MSRSYQLLVMIMIIAGCQPAEMNDEAKSASPEQIVLNQSPDTAEVFGAGFISTGLYERDLAISADGNEMIYTLGNYKQTLRSLIMIKKENGQWGEKQILSFSGTHQDIEPCYSPDGTQLFFASNRPMSDTTDRKDYNIWVSKKSNGQWGAPQPLGVNINTEKDEFYPSVSNNGNLYFTATRTDGIGREDIFVSSYLNGAYQRPIPLDTNINTAVYEFNAYVNPEEDLLIFSSYGRKDGLGGGDLYYSKKDNEGRWSSAKNLGPKINSTKLDYCPFVDIPRGNFYFSSEWVPPFTTSVRTVEELTEQANSILNGMGNIYRINIKQLNLK